MKKFMTLVLAVVFLNFVIAPDPASATTSGFGGDLDLPPSRSEAGGAAAIIVGAVIVVAGLFFLASKIAGPKDNKPTDQKPGDSNQNMKNLLPRSENDSLEIMSTTKPAESPVTPSGELVLVKW